jgi:uncharacterized protein YbjT (DUF2867 family)
MGVEARKADYDKPETLESALSGVDTLLLISTRLRRPNALVFSYPLWPASMP